MAARVTAAEVEEIWKPPINMQTPELERVIDETSAWLDSLSVPLSAALLKAVERYLVPFFANANKLVPSSASVGSVSQTRTGGFFAAGLLGDPWGQRAVTLDTTGTLLEIARQAAKAASGEDGGSIPTFMGISNADQDALASRTVVGING